ncbi:peptidoglycan bridge formation glycyltransferase FemA/FemB family protein [Candidatus Saccharibacteria bacterium]|nr:peptidoglycan bridge formation glycyltransferase FemA/FemB family protein [Candidatus Saccharibacteria bacterium]
MLTNKDQWDQKQLRRGASFLQSLKWAEFQESVGFKPHFLSGPGWSCMVLEKTNRFGKYLFAPYGPTLDSSARLAACLSDLSELAGHTGADWLKIEPTVTSGNLSDLLSSLMDANGRRADHNVEPALSRVLDLSPEPEELLAGISQSTRSLIRKNQRESILTFQTSTTPSDLAGFAAMLDAVAERKGIGFFSAGYFIKQAQILMPAKMMFLEQAFEGKELVGAAVMHDYGKTSSYTYAAALPEARKLSVSALLLWQAIINARARGINQLDLYGIAPDDAPLSHPWYGFSTYKKKFGGSVVELAGTWDIPITKKYRLYRAAQKLHHVVRRH